LLLLLLLLINHMQSEERYTFYFKIVYTDKIFQFSFQPSATIKFFTEFVNEEMRHIEPNNTIEIVESGESENAPVINYSETSTLEQVFGNRWKTTSFYIRFVPISERW
jgi:hypothetical protein